MMMQRNDNQSQLSITSIITSKDFHHQKAKFKTVYKSSTNYSILV